MLRGQGVEGNKQSGEKGKTEENWERVGPWMPIKKEGRGMKEEEIN